MNDEAGTGGVHAIQSRAGRTIRPARPDDWERIAQLRQAAFNWPGEPDLLEGMWVLADGGAIVGCARLETEGQWLGGRGVPTGVVSSVAVDPVARGRGAGTELVRALLHESRASSLSRVVLYPSAVRPYRRAGFEIAGVHVTQTLDAADLPRFEPTPVVAMTPDDHAAVAACYERVASRRNGAIVRSERWWGTRVLATAPPTPRAPADLQAYIARDGEAVAGYVLFSQVATGDDPYAIRIVCRELVWETESAGRALFALLAGGRPMTTAVDWPGESLDPAVVLLEDPPHVSSSAPWMARLVDPVAALAEQGFAPGVRAELAFRVVDPFEPGWSTGLRVRIRDGRAEVEPAEVDAASVDVGALAAILAGALDPVVAARLGRLTPGPDGIGPFEALPPPGRPWIGDRF